MKATVLVRPEARASSTRRARPVQSSLRQLGFAVDEARVGRVDRSRGRRRGRRRRARRARADVRAAAREPADRVLRDRWRAMRPSPGRESPSLRLPGSNDDRDAALRARARSAPSRRSSGTPSRSCPDVGARRPARRVLVRRLPSLRRDRPLRTGDGGGARVRGRAAGSCSGSATASRSSARPDLLPGALRPNASLEFVCRDVHAQASSAPTRPFTSRCEAGQTLTIPIKHGEGCYFADEELLQELERSGQIVLRYEQNPNGSVADDRRRHERARERLRPDAAPRARGRPAARLDRRRARARARWSTRPASACSHGSLSPSASASAGRLARRRAQPVEIAAAERHRPAAGRAARRVGEAHQPLAAGRLEQLHHRREALLARALGQRQLLDELCRAPGCRRLRHRNRR